MASPNVALALRRALDVESVPLERPPRRPGPAWLLNPRRLEIVLAAAAYPGIHLRSASRLLLSPLPSLRFHLRRLVDERILKTRRTEGRVHLFVPSMYPASAERFLVAWQDARARKVLEFVSAKGSVLRSEIVRGLSLPEGSLDGVLRRLEACRAVRVRPSRSGSRIRVTAAWDSFRHLCANETDARLRRFLALLEAQGLHPSAETVEGHRARIRVDGPRSTIRFVLPLNPLE